MDSEGLDFSHGIPNAPDKTKLEPGTIYSATPSQQPENETTIETTETRISSSPTLMMTKDSVSSPPSLLRTHNISSFPNNVPMTEKDGGSFSVTEDIGSSVSELLVIEDSISSSPTVLVTQDIGTFSPTLLMTEYNVSQFPTFPLTEVEGSDSSSPTLLDTEDGSRSHPSFLVTEDNSNFMEHDQTEFNPPLSSTFEKVMDSSKKPHWYGQTKVCIFCNRRIMERFFVSHSETCSAAFKPAINIDFETPL